MKSIIPYTAVLDNAGQRIEAGVVLKVGRSDDAIAADRAAELVDQRLAEVVAAGTITPPALPDMEAGE